MAASFGTAGTLAGIDPMRDLDTVVLAATGATNDARAVAILRGRFPFGKTQGGHLYHGVPVFYDPKNSSGALAVLDAETAVVGPEAEVRRAIDRHGSGSKPPEVAGRFTALAQGSAFWGAGITPAGDLESIDRFEFAASLGDGLRAGGEVHVRDAAAAAKLEALLKGFHPAPAGNGAAGGSRFEVRVENGTLRLDLFVPAAELHKAVEAQKVKLADMLQRGFAAAAAGALPPGPAAVAPRPPAPAAAIVTNDRGETVVVTLPGRK